jgi:hypothetical protein
MKLDFRRTDCSEKRVVAQTGRKCREFVKKINTERREKERVVGFYSAAGVYIPFQIHKDFGIA